MAFSLRSRFFFSPNQFVGEVLSSQNYERQGKRGAPLSQHASQRSVDEPRGAGHGQFTFKLLMLLDSSPLIFSEL